MPCAMLIRVACITTALLGAMPEASPVQGCGHVCVRKERSRSATAGTLSVIAATARATTAPAPTGACPRGQPNPTMTKHAPPHAGVAPWIHKVLQFVLEIWIAHKIPEVTRR